MNDLLTVGDRYHEVMQDFDEGIRAGLHGYLKCGRAIEAIKEEKLWRREGNHVRNFAHFCKQVLQISPAQAHRMAQVYREVGHLLTQPSLQQDISKVTLLLPHLTGQSDEKKEALLLEARDITYEALRNNILERQGQGDRATDKCMHDGEMEVWDRCKKCGKFLK